VNGEWQNGEEIDDRTPDRAAADYSPFTIHHSPPDQMPRDDDAHDLVGTLQDLVDAKVAHQLLDAVVVQVAVAAEELQGVVGDGEARIGDEALGHGRPFRRVVRAGVELRG